MTQICIFARDFYVQETNLNGDCTLWCSFLPDPFTQNKNANVRLFHTGALKPED